MATPQAMRKQDLAFQKRVEEKLGELDKLNETMKHLMELLQALALEDALKPTAKTAKGKKDD